ncbi:MAG TPA: SGNH/GDSL hydrolase family protein [Candidatus Limnocylindrales bacterium]|nr:SGNH/GDSL hydrolase family protein [Candidatus Limnocylindrales bacterium]
MTTRHRSQPPNPRSRARPGIAVLVASLWLLTGGALTTSAATPYPRSMASTGDSITRAYNTGFFPYIDNPAASWSTGTNGSVVSHYTRVLALQPSIAGRAYNDAKSGAKMIDLAGQLTTAATQHVDYVTVLMGGNDICTLSESSMTSVATFQSQFASALNTFTSGSPSTRIYVVSIPNVYNLWAVLRNSFTARTVWSLFNVCPSMLANPLSTAQADVDRRARVLQRELDFNGVLQSVCAQYARCRYDGGAVFGTPFVASDITARDYFHPSTAGQAKLAAVTWAAGYWGP